MSCFLIKEAVDMSKYARVMDVNFWGSVYPTFYAMPHLRRTRGKIVVNASTTAIMHPPSLSFYAASKSAILSFYECLRHELAPEISITIATLGFIDSELTRGKHLSKKGTIEVDQRIREISNLHPVMTSNDCAKCIVNEACRGGRYVTEPKYYGTLMMIRNLCPELLQWYYQKLLNSMYLRDESIHLADTNTRSKET
ncbi:hypothetical protein M9H77_29205 [Catharanthus roseus]|uniref:Uncharacterized protein n=1 Tax=Catharanthus roseus TaxID=4058 RepID=A0ACC0AIY7_CATRO|nr:hypothetical protein M9H77_29205 [Catharanthus roseus]